MNNINENYQVMFTSYPDIVNINQLKDMLGIGITLAYRLVKQNTINSLKIGREYKIPKLCVIDYIYNQKTTDFSDFLKDYGDILDYKEVRKILRNPSRNTLYKILKNKEIYFIMIANEYKIPKSCLVEYVFNNYF